MANCRCGHIIALLTFGRKRARARVATQRGAFAANACLATESRKTTWSLSQCVRARVTHTTIGMRAQLESPLWRSRVYGRAARMSHSESSFESRMSLCVRVHNNIRTSSSGGGSAHRAFITVALAVWARVRSSSLRFRTAFCCGRRLDDVMCRRMNDDLVLDVRARNCKRAQTSKAMQGKRTTLDVRRNKIIMMNET